MRRKFLATVIIALLPGVALADIAGVASVIDADTLEIHGTRIRLHGVDAPESGQQCNRADGTSWALRTGSLVRPGRSHRP
jgi:endonuclease YncB( thermonuclease family)